MCNFVHQCNHLITSVLFIMCWAHISLNKLLRILKTTTHFKSIMIIKVGVSIPKLFYKCNK